MIVDNLAYIMFCFAPINSNVTSTGKYSTCTLVFSFSV